MRPEERRWCRGSLQKKFNTYSSALLASLVPGVAKVTIIFIGLECVQPPEDDSPHTNLELIYQPPCPYDEYARSLDHPEAVLCRGQKVASTRIAEADHPGEDSVTRPEAFVCTYISTRSFSVALTSSFLI